MIVSSSFLSLWHPSFLFFLLHHVLLTFFHWFPLSLGVLMGLVLRLFFLLYCCLLLNGMYSRPVIFNMVHVLKNLALTCSLYSRLSCMLVYFAFIYTWKLNMNHKYIISKKNYKFYLKSPFPNLIFKNYELSQFECAEYYWEWGAGEWPKNRIWTPISGFIHPLDIRSGRKVCKKWKS